MKVLARRFALLLGLAQSACVAEVESFVFACTGADCPPGFVCGATGTCVDETLGGAAFYSECTDDEGCFERSCVLLGAAPTGLCSVSCDGAAATCPTVGGRAGVCNYIPVMDPPVGVCQAGCTRDADCPLTFGGQPMDCVTTPMTDGLGSCFLPAPSWSNIKLCAEAADCTAPEACQLVAGVGVCAWPCGRPGDPCPGSDACVDTGRSFGNAMRDGFLCLPTCPLGNECGAGFTCTTVGNDSRAVCLPTAWN